MPGLSLNGRRYELRRLPLARGGMGEVWLGHDNRLKREVVVKFLRIPPGAEDEEHIRRRFERESMITARLEHPGVPAVYDVGIDDDGTPYMVMQRIRGLTLADLIVDQHPDTLPIGWIAAIGAQVCSVLAAAHGEGLIHRDLKPGNVMLEPYGAVKVLDFGLATAPSDADFSRITQMGAFLGTPGYMAPEQVQSNDLGPAIDLYALGCTLHEMLTGVPLFSGPTPYSLMNQQVNGIPPLPRERRSDVPIELEQMVMQLLEKKPEARPASAEEVYQRLLPFSVDLGPLPGALDPPSTVSPARMYAGVLQRVFAKTAVPQPQTAMSSTDARDKSLPARQELKRARAEVAALLQRNRSSEAAAVLAQAERAAGRLLDDADADLMSVRYELAKLLFDAADYESAEPIFQRLADLYANGAAVSDLEFDCRFKAAMCDALSDRRREAMARIAELLADYRMAHGDTDARALRLRRHLGQLQLSVGEDEAAKRTFTALLATVQDSSGEATLDVDEIVGILAGINDEGTRSIDPGWQDVLRYADLGDPAMGDLVAELSRRGVTAPVVGYELGEEGWLAELAWPIRKTAVMVVAALDEQELTERGEAYRAAGWDARPATGWTADEISRRVTA